VARRTGRRPGNPATREAILEASREVFAERGYDAASIRQIATGAGVDPALVHHYFGNKEQLFLAAVQAPIDPRELIPQILAGGVDGVGERLVRTFVHIWDSPRGTTAAALLRSAVTNEWTAKMLREFVMTQILRRAIRELGLEGPDALLRAGLVASQVLGLATTRYVLKLEPLTTASPDQLAAAIGPTIQRYLTGDIGEEVSGYT
jgi:AcrR family transcriptional regulator